MPTAKTYGTFLIEAIIVAEIQNKKAATIFALEHWNRIAEWACVNLWRNGSA